VRLQEDGRRGIIEDMDREGFIKGLEDDLQRATQRQIEAIHSHDLVTFQGAVRSWNWAAETWLATQGISQEEAQSLMTGRLIVTRE